MTGEEQIRYEETRIIVYNRAKGNCEVCGDRVSYVTFQMAHRVPQRRWAIKKYGKEAIHHNKNFKATCSLGCNGRASIAGHPIECDKLMAEIQEELNGE